MLKSWYDDPVVKRLRANLPAIAAAVGIVLGVSRLAYSWMARVVALEVVYPNMQQDITEIKRDVKHILREMPRK